MSSSGDIRHGSSGPRASRRTIIQTEGSERTFLDVKRARRPDRAPPQNRLGGSQYGSRERKNVESTSASRAERAYVSRVTETAAQFQGRLKENKRHFCKSFPTMEYLREMTTSTMRGILQGAVDQAIFNAKESHPCGGTLNETRKRNVVCVQLGYRCCLRVPNYTCNSCKATVTVHPFEVGCTPTSPTEYCETWIGLDYCLLFRDLQLHNGLSADAFVHATQNLERYFNPEGCQLYTPENVRLKAAPGLQSDHLTIAVTEFSKMEISISSLYSESELSSDPFIHCPACATTLRTVLDDGITPVPCVPLSVCTDGINAANHFASAGRSQGQVKATTHTYIGELADVVRGDHGSGRLSSLAQKRQRQASVLEDGGDSIMMACSAALSCNRAVSNMARGELDQYGMISVVCSHVIPGLGLSIPMLTPEQHYYYDVVLGDTLRRRPDLAVVYLDLACRYANGRWNVLLQELVEQEHITNEQRDRVQMLLPWMHAFDHDIKCQLKYSAMYKDGVARRVGEQTEALWSLTKPFHKRARYMTPAHWQDNTNQLLWQLTLRKQKRFPKMLQRKLVRIETKIEECKKVLTELQDEACSHGVNDLEDALKSLEDHDLNEQAELSIKAQYVEVLLKLRSHTTISKEKAVLPLLLPGNAGANAFQKSNNVSTRLKLETALERLAVALDLPLDVEWDENCEEYQEGLHELAAFVICKYQRRIEEQVFKRKLLLLDLEQSDSGKNSQKLRKSLRSTKKNIEELLSVRETWIALKGNRSEANITESFIREVCTGCFPWTAENSVSNGTAPAQRYFAQRYRSAACQLRRSEEEKVFLRREVVRMHNWVEERNSELLCELTDKQQRLAALQDVLNDVLSEHTQLPPPEKSKLKEEVEWLLGRINLLKRDITWNKLILNDAKDRLSEYILTRCD